MALAVVEIVYNIGQNIKAGCIARKQEKVDAYRRGPYVEQKIAELYKEDAQSPCLFPVGQTSHKSEPKLLNGSSHLNKNQNKYDNKLATDNGLTESNQIKLVFGSSPRLMSSLNSSKAFRESLKIGKMQNSMKLLSNNVLYSKRSKQ